jgi:hypothetical protein
VVVQRASTGHRKNKTCVRGRPHHHQHTCTRYDTVGTFTVRHASGAGSAKLHAKLGKHKLVKGTYHLVVTPVGSDGRHGKARTVTVTVT